MMELRATNKGTTEAFARACFVEKGDDFVVVCKDGGWVEVYDTDLKLISTEVFLNIQSVKAGKFITVTLKNGWSEIYDKWFNMQSVKYLGP